MKTVRQTSIDVYYQIKNEGLLPKMRMKIYEAIFNNSQCTAMEYFEANNLRTNQSGRFTELREMGVIIEVGIRECKISGRKAIIWQVTNKLPTPFKSKKTVLNFKKSINHIIYKMEKSSVMFVDKDWLNNLVE